MIENDPQKDVVYLTRNVSRSMDVVQTFKTTRQEIEAWGYDLADLDWDEMAEIWENKIDGVDGIEYDEDFDFVSTDEPYDYTMEM